MPMMPKLKPSPELLIRNSKQFKNSSALVLNSLFWHSPTLKNAPAPELMPSLAPSLQPENKPQQPITPKGFFNNQDFGKGAEGLGDLFSSLASGDLDNNPSLFVDQAGDSDQQRQANPATLFSPHNKQPRLTPMPHSPEAEQKRKLQEELERNAKRRKLSR